MIITLVELLLKKSVMNSILKLLVLFLFGTNSMCSQGGWDIKYNPISDLNESFINKPIFIDFKSDDNDNYEETSEEDAFFLTLNVRELLSTIDEFEIVTSSGENLTFIETWKIYDDMGFLSNQCYGNANNNEFIKNIDLIGITKDRLFFEGNLYTSNSSFTPIAFSVAKNKAKGFLTILEQQTSE